MLAKILTVYVDDMYTVPMGEFGRMKMSHMVADTDDELHAMADAIGIARKWYQGDHYDISITKRTLAISKGAIAISMRQCAAYSALRRRFGVIVPPHIAAVLRYGKDYPL